MDAEPSGHSYVSPRPADTFAHPSTALSRDESISRADDREGSHRLRSIVSDLITALNEALRDDGGAESFLRRAVAILDVREPKRAIIAAVVGGLAPWQILRVTAYIQENLDKPIKNGELAAVARLSPCHFNRAFRNSLGDSPHFYVIRRRIQRAQGLMLSTHSPLSQIAIDCGLADQPHFTRLFRRLLGVSPAAWRKARLSPPLILNQLGD
jgi:AraC family transcriptional regulator